FDTIPIWAVALMLAMLLGGIGFTIYRTRQRKQEMDNLLSETPVAPLEESFEEIELDVNEKSNYKKQIDNFVDRKPDAVAQLLKTWLNED
ncbi:MAG: flagellar M-ring protein FliF, partial [Thermotaleaceae bacterium]